MGTFASGLHVIHLDLLYSICLMSFGILVDIWQKDVGIENRARHFSISRRIVFIGGFGIDIQLHVFAF